jgi:hypothetical protein
MEPTNPAQARPALALKRLELNLSKIQRLNSGQLAEDRKMTSKPTARWHRSKEALAMKERFKSNAQGALVSASL